MIDIRKKINMYYILSILYGISLTIFGAISYVFLVKSGFTYDQIGIYLSTFWIVSMIFEIPTGIIVDVYKHKKTLIMSNIVRMVGIGFLAFNNGNMVLLISSSILTGFSEAVQSGNLSSWIVNEINESKEDVKLNLIFSRLSIVATIFGLISGYLGSNYLYKWDIRLPFIFSIALFTLITVLISIFFKKEKKDEKLEEESVIKIEEQYKEVIKQVKFMLFRKELYYFLAFFLIIDLVNLGPSEQWQVVYKEFNLGIIWVFIGIAGILGSYLPSKLNVEKISKKRNLIAFLLLDIFVVFIQTMSEKLILMFFIHIVMFSVLGIVLSTYKHLKLIKNNEIRATAVSVLNTFDALIMTTLLSINGYLSSRVGILNSWKIFIVLSLIIVVILVFWKEPQYD